MLVCVLDGINPCVSYLQLLHLDSSKLFDALESLQISARSLAQRVVADLEVVVEGVQTSPLHHHAVPALALDEVGHVHLRQVVELLLLTNLRKETNENTLNS